MNGWRTIRAEQGEPAVNSFYEACVRSLGQFHDGFYNGLFIRRSSVDLFVANHEDRRFVMSATDVAALSSSDIRAGNIIFDIVSRSGVEITLDDIYEAYGFSDRHRDAPHAQRALAKAFESGLSFLAISSSYGGTCAVLAKTVRLRTEYEWVSEMCFELRPKPASIQVTDE